MDSPPALRRARETTQASESLNDALRQGWQGRGAFPKDDAIVQRFSRGLQHVANKWTQPIPAWQAALKQCVMLCGERVPRCKKLHRDLDNLHRLVIRRGLAVAAGARMKVYFLDTSTLVKRYHYGVVSNRMATGHANPGSSGEVSVSDADSVPT